MLERDHHKSTRVHTRCETLAGHKRKTARKAFNDGLRGHVQIRDHLSHFVLGKYLLARLHLNEPQLNCSSDWTLMARCAVENKNYRAEGFKQVKGKG